ncbi:hypothetical protein D3C83_19970 [compost metagenome]
MRPHRGHFRNARAVGLVSSQTGACKSIDQPEIARIFARRQPRLRSRPFEMVVADVIGAPLEERDRNRDFERIPDGRNIAVEELVLQRFRSGGEDDLAARHERRHEIGESLAGAGARLRHQHLITRYGLCHRTRHFELKRPRAKIVD